MENVLHVVFRLSYEFTVPYIIMRTAQLHSANVDKQQMWGEFQPVVAVSIRTIVTICVIVSGVFNLRSKNTENRTL